MRYSEFKRQIDNGDVPNMFLFAGEEEYLREYATSYLKQKLIRDDKFDIHLLQGSGSRELLPELMDSFPIFNSCKFILIRNSGFFTREGRREDEELVESISRSGINNYIVFHEDKANKESVMYKTIRREGIILDCGIQKDTELAQWSVNVFKKEGFRIDLRLAEKFIGMSERRMKSIMNDIQKIISYKGKDKLIREEDINLMTTRSINDSIFSLLDAISARNKNDAVYILDEMIRLRQKEQYILYMITVNFIDMLNVVMSRKKNRNFKEIAEDTGIRYDWKVKKLLSYSKKFSEKEIKRIIGCCAEADMNIKKGLYKGRLSLEMLISEIVR